MNLIPTVHKQLLFSWLDILTSGVKILNNAENIFMRYKTEIVQNSNNKIFLIRLNKCVQRTELLLPLYELP